MIAIADAITITQTRWLARGVVMRGMPVMTPEAYVSKCPLWHHKGSQILAHLLKRRASEILSLLVPCLLEYTGKVIFFFLYFFFLRKKAPFHRFLFLLPETKIQHDIITRLSFPLPTGRTLYIMQPTQRGRNSQVFTLAADSRCSCFCFPPTCWRATKRHYISCINTRQWDPHEGLYSNTLFYF